MPALRKVSAALTLLILSVFAFAASQELVPKPTWTPPAPRKAKTPFAPKPFAGDNIFKGEAEIWLADALEKLGAISSRIDDEVVNEYVTRVGDNLVSYSVTPKKQSKFIVTSDWTPDAMTAGGDRIYITCGMLEQVESEDELAGILAHEIAHNAFAHTAKTITR